MKITHLLIVAALVAPVMAQGPIKKKSGKEVVFTNLFNQADTNGNEILDFEEFSNSYGASERPVVTLFRFNALSGRFVDTRGLVVIGLGVNLGNFIEANGGRKINPNKSQIFLTADTDRNGFLSPEEFYATRIQSASSEASSMKAFDKLDKNDDNQISPSEFGATLIKA
jgi:hypothetical protein